MREGLAQCTGDFVLFLRAGDRLTSDALYHNVIQLQQPGVKAIYADEDCYCFHGEAFHRHSPTFKPDLDLDYLLSGNYVGRFVLFDRLALAKIGDPKEDVLGAEEFDLLLRFIEAASTKSIVHLPRVIYHRYQPDDATAVEDITTDALSRAVNDYLVRNGLAATAEPHTDSLGSSRPSAVRLRWSLPAPAPKVSLIISTKDHPELIGPCIASLLATAKNYRGEVEILVVDNGTTDSIACALLKILRESGSIRTISYPGAFNFSRMNNQAADHACGDVLIFLNNDVLAISEGWVDELVSHAIRPNVGAVGGRLLYADDTIQHAGIVLGVNGSTCHEAIGEPVANGGYLGRSHLQRLTSAVTGACLATRKDVFIRMNGFDEIIFQITYNDIDYCLKVTAAGFDVVYTPFASLHHLESVTRGFDSESRLAKGVEALAAFRAKWSKALQNDPFYNPHFSRAGRPFAYLSASKRH
jgi:GT2 family glycosyltransferase